MRIIDMPRKHILQNLCNTNFVLLDYKIAYMRCVYLENLTYLRGLISKEFLLFITEKSLKVSDNLQISWAKGKFMLIDRTSLNFSVVDERKAKLEIIKVCIKHFFSQEGNIYCNELKESNIRPITLIQDDIIESVFESFLRKKSVSSDSDMISFTSILKGGIY